MEETTYLEEFLLSLELLPNDVRRDCELMREHDKESIEIIKELAEQELIYLQKCKKAKTDTSEPSMVQQLDEINTLRQKAKQRLTQKKAIASNMLKDLEKFRRKLDTDLAFFETDLRGCGEFEQLSRGVEAGSDVRTHEYH